jgi:phospholipid-binding lipoprotein MlaA
VRNRRSGAMDRYNYGEGGRVNRMMRSWAGALVGVTGILFLVGCGGHQAAKSHLQEWKPFTEATPHETAGVLLASASDLYLVASDSAKPPSQKPPAQPKTPVPAESDQTPADDPFYDPFATADESANLEEYDPWEPLNTKVFEFNRQVDRWVLKPVAQAYNAVLPDAAQIGISNFFYNIRFPSRFINNLAQGKWNGARVEVGRFVLNSSFGLAGFVDVAKYLDVTTPEEDTGQTLGFYGVKPGPYLVLPFLPPFTVRDFVGYMTDIALNPINWLVFPLVEIEGVPSLVAHHNRMTTTIVQYSARVGEVINERSRNLENYQGVEEATLDMYAAVRNFYLQRRAKAIRE